MSDNTGTSGQGSANPAENLDRWIADYDKTEIQSDAGADAQGSESEPSDSHTEAAPSPEGPKTGAWREAVLDDVDHGFFMGRKAGDLFDSYRHAETAMQKAQREAAELRAELQQLRQQQRPIGPAKSEVDVAGAEIDRLWFENPAKAREMLREQIREEQRQVTQEVLADRDQTQAWESLKTNSFNATSQAIQYVADAYGVDGDRATRMVMGTFPHLKYQEAADPYIWANPNAYVTLIADLFGTPPPRDTANVAQQATVDIPNPPGNRRPAPSANPANQRTASALSSEEQSARREIARIVGLSDPDKFATQSRNARKS